MRENHMVVSDIKLSFGCSPEDGMSQEQQDAIEARALEIKTEIEKKALNMAEQIQHDWACGKDRSSSAECDMSAGFDEGFMNALSACIYLFEHPTKSDHSHKLALQNLVLAHRKGMAELFEGKIGEDYD